MPKVIFSYDTEDYVNPHAVGGVIRSSKIAREGGFIPCHNVVAWLAQNLIKWGRYDAIEEIKKCELSTHSLKHSYHPNINEYTDIEDFGEAIRRFRNEEDEGCRILKDIFDMPIYACCPPGNSCSYVGYYGFADMGIPVYTGGYAIDKRHNRPVSYCNILVLDYDVYIDNFGEIEKEDIEKMVEKFADHEVWVIAHHPAKNAIKDFTDDINFNKTNIEGDWILSESRSPEWIAKFVENLKYLLKLLNEDDRFEPATYKDIAQLYSNIRIIKPIDLLGIKEALEEDFFPITTPISLCLADIMLACRDFLLGKKEHLCEKVYGFIEAPYTVDKPVKITLEDLKASAEQIKDNEFLPARIRVGDTDIGPADWLRAALAFLTGAEEYTVTPGEWQIDLEEFPALKYQRLAGNWLNSDDFEDKYLSDRGRLQSWTLRLPQGSKRRVFD